MLDKQELDAEKNKDALVPVCAVLTDTVVTVNLSADAEELSAKGYGNTENNKLELTSCEALYLLSKGIIEVKDSKNKEIIVFEDLLKRFQAVDKDAWVRYLIYRDLRSRGYVAREGFGKDIDFRLYERGDYGKGTAKHLIFGIQEGQPVTLEKLARTQRYTQNLKKNLVLAVINRRGEIVYYSLSELNLK
ncbi:MAG: tRNA-intron lyase [Candidatus Bathyarchaeum tardum]|nr:MAG: tRNA-intron lyase [Candidatus Bathyarchaeum tardum]